MSPSTSLPAKVNNVALAAAVSRTSTTATVPRVGVSFTAVTTIEIDKESVAVVSSTLNTRSPIVSLSLLASAFGVKVKPVRSAVSNTSPTATVVPLAVVIIPPEGTPSTVIVIISPSDLILINQSFQVCLR